MINTGIAAKFAEKETPFYYYDLNVLNKTLEAAHAASHKRGFHVHYALKANFNDELLKAIQEIGFGADCVSGNEVKKAIECGFDSKKVTFAGVGKSDKEINYALDQNIFAFNVESIQEQPKCGCTHPSLYYNRA